MEIIRHGADRYRGAKSIRPEIRTAIWESGENCVTLISGPTTDFSSAASHIYRLQLSLPEIAQLLRLVATVALDKNRDAVEDAFAGSAAQLFNLLDATAGIADGVVHY